jgi:2-keto-4-pentenoate hydratase/2-oxohepta-3-ene-1,7-dioic acid hydratase in catechol pathway
LVLVPATHLAPTHTDGRAVMKIMRVQADGGEPGWAINEGDSVYALAGDVYTAPKKGALIGPVSSVKTLSPILPHNKIVVILENWRDKSGRFGPSFIMKNITARINPGETIIYPRIATRVFFETELGIVIGKKARSVSVEDAKNYIMDYTIHNDMTSFAFNVEVGMDPVVFGKGFDTFSMCGPCIATDLDPTKLTMRGRINGEEFFETSSGLMLWNAFELVSWVSSVTALYPGDIISCGAPQGAMDRQTYPGDRVTLVIDEIGEISSPVVAEA